MLDGSVTRVCDRIGALVRPNGARRFLVSGGLGALAVPLASFWIALLLSGASVVAYLVALGDPGDEFERLLAQATAVLERSGRASVALSLVVIGRYAWSHRRLHRHASLLWIATAAWLAGWPLRDRAVSLAAFALLDSGASWALYALAVGVGAAWGTRDRGRGLQLLRRVRALRRSTSAADLVRQLSRCTPGGCSRVALYASDAPRLGPRTTLGLVASSCDAPDFTSRVSFPGSAPSAHVAFDGASPDLPRRAPLPRCVELARAAALLRLRRWPVVALRSAEAVALGWPLGDRFLLAFGVSNPEGPTGVLFVEASRRSDLQRLQKTSFLTLVEQAAGAWRVQGLLLDAHRSGRQRERLRVAHQLHDTLAQDLISARLHLELGRPQEPMDARQVAWCEAERIVRRSLDAARKLAWEFHDAAIEDVPISRILETETAESARALALDVRFEHVGLEVEIGADTCELLIAITREGLRNVQKHSGARSARVTLTVHTSTLSLDVFDPGGNVRGACDPSDLAAGFGLHALRKRVEARGGQLTLESEPRSHTVLSVSIPWRSRSAV